tara:strand:+ start:48 stop:353 length:306 start_codon:yes stop_codon:yes gene_type:complete
MVYSRNIRANFRAMDRAFELLQVATQTVTPFRAVESVFDALTTPIPPEEGTYTCYEMVPVTFTVTHLPDGSVHYDRVKPQAIEGASQDGDTTEVRSTAQKV